MSETEVANAPKKRGRPPKPKPGDANFKPDHRGPQPHFPVFGESWEDANGVIKFWHGSGFYLDPPGKSAEARAEEMGKAAIAELEPAPGTGAAAIAAMKAGGTENQSNGAASPVVSEDDGTAPVTGGDAVEQFEEIADVEIHGVDDDDTDPVIMQLEAMAGDFQIGELKYIVADARDFVLALFKENPKPWSAMPEAKQYDLARGIENVMSDLVQKIAEAVATNEKQPIRCFLESYVEKDGVKVTLKLKPAGEQEELQAIIGLHKAKGKMVLLTDADAADYRAERKAQTDADEPGLEFDAEPEHPDDDSDLAEGDDDYDFGAGEGDD